MECDIDFIKWMCEKAEGFSVDIGQDGNEQYYFISDPNDFDTDIDEVERCNILYPLLLQRAIEGVNKQSVLAKNNGYIIDNQRSCVVVYRIDDYHTSRSHWSFLDDLTREWYKNGVTPAKESALKYIYEQETT